MKLTKGHITAFIMILIATALNIGLFLFFELSLKDYAGFVQSNYVLGSGTIGFSTALAAVFWLLFIGDYWGFLTGNLPAEKKVAYQRGMGSGIIFLGSSISVLIFMKWGSISNLTLGETLNSLSIALSAFGILWVLIVQTLGIGIVRELREKREALTLGKHQLQQNRGKKLLLILVSLAIAFGFELIFVYAGRGTIINLSQAVGKTILEPSIDYALWAIFWIAFMTVIAENISWASKLKTFTIALWCAIIAYLVFSVLKHCTGYLEQGPISAVLSTWSIFGLMLAINAKIHLKD